MVLPIRLYCRSCGEERLHAWQGHWQCAGCGSVFPASVVSVPEDPFYTRKAARKGGKSPKGPRRGLKWRYA